MKKRSAGILIFLCALWITGCKKSTYPEPGSTVSGTITLKIHAVHHSYGVPYLPVFIKKNCTQFPGNDTTLYDMRLVADNDGYLTVEHLFPGNYYLFGKGFDYYWGANVYGHEAIVLNSSTLIDNSASTTLFVSE